MYYGNFLKYSDGFFHFLNQQEIHDTWTFKNTYGASVYTWTAVAECLGLSTCNQRVAGSRLPHNYNSFNHTMQFTTNSVWMGEWLMKNSLGSSWGLIKIYTCSAYFPFTLKTTNFMNTIASWKVKWKIRWAQNRSRRVKKPLARINNAQ